MNLEEKITLLKELRDFYKSLPEDMSAHVKFMPIETMLELLEMVNLDEYSLEEIVNAFLDEDMMEKVIKKSDFTQEELEYFFGGVWAAIWILKWDQKIIDSNKKMLGDCSKIKQELEEITAKKDREEKEDQIEWLKAEINIRIYKDKKD